MEDWGVDLSHCNFATAQFPAERGSLQLRNHPFEGFNSEFLSPFNFVTHEMGDPFATPQV